MGGKPMRAATASQSGAAASDPARRAWRLRASERNGDHDALADYQRGEEIYSGPGDVLHPETPSVRRESGKKGPGMAKHGAEEQDRGSNIPLERATGDIPSTPHAHCYVSEMFGVRPAGGHQARARCATRRQRIRQRKGPPLRAALGGG